MMHLLERTEKWWLFYEHVNCEVPEFQAWRKPELKGKNFIYVVEKIVYSSWRKGYIVVDS